MWNVTIRCDLNATAGQRPALPDQPQSRVPEPKCTCRARERGPLARTFAITTRDCEHITLSLMLRKSYHSSYSYGRAARAPSGEMPTWA